MSREPLQGYFEIALNLIRNLFLFVMKKIIYFRKEKKRQASKNVTLQKLLQNFLFTIKFRSSSWRNDFHKEKSHNFSNVRSEGYFTNLFSQQGDSFFVVMKNDYISGFKGKIPKLHLLWFFCHMTILFMFSMLFVNKSLHKPFQKSSIVSLSYSSLALCRSLKTRH